GHAAELAAARPSTGPRRRGHAFPPRLRLRGPRARGPPVVIAAVVLAAGLARRMGRQKLLLQLQGKPVVRWSVEHVVKHVEDVVIVTGPDDTAIRQALEDLTVRFVVNPRPQDGQGTSIAAGVAALKPW